MIWSGLLKILNPPPGLVRSYMRPLGSDGKIASVSLQQCADGTIINQRYDMEWTLEDIKSSTRPRTLVYEASGDGTPRPSRTPEKGARTNINGKYSGEQPRSKANRNPAIPSPDILKDYVFVSQTEFLTSTTQGRVLLCSMELPRNDVKGDVRGLPGLLKD